MTSGSRTPSWKERENNKRRERRRRAVAAKIYTGLRLYGNYQLPKHCDNNEVLKALCNEAGWIVEEDGLTYPKGTKPPQRTGADAYATSAFMSPMSSSYPSPASSACPSPVRHTSSFGGPEGAPGEVLIPWLRGLSSSSVVGAGAGGRLLYVRYGGCYSAPVTPRLSSPTAIRSPRSRSKRPAEWDNLLALNSKNEDAVPDCAATALLNAWAQYPVVSSHGSTGVASCPASPGPLLCSAAVPSTCLGSGCAATSMMGMWVPQASTVASSSTAAEAHISMWRPGYSYVVSPAASVCNGGFFVPTAAPVAGTFTEAEAEAEVCGAMKDDCGSRSSGPGSSFCNNNKGNAAGPVMAWQGEHIHAHVDDNDEDDGIRPEDLELTLGFSSNSQR